MRSVLATELRRVASPLGLNEMAVLYRVSSGDLALSLAGVADFLATSRALARQAVRRLSEKGLIAGRDDPQDRRSRLWHATSAGVVLTQQSTEVVPADAPVARALAALPLSDIGRLRVDLDRLAGDLGTFSIHDSARGQDDAARGGRPDDHRFFDLWLSIARAYRFVRAEQTRFLLDATDQVVDTPAYMTLYRLHERPSATAEIAVFLQIDQNTATRLIDRLEQHGLVFRTRNRSSRREVTISASEKGVRLLGTVPPIDPNGRYLAALQRLPEGGVELDDILRRVVAGYAAEPIIDHQIFYALLKSVSENLARQRGAARVEGKQFRSAMSQFLTGVAVVTVGDTDAPRCITVNSLTSVSLDPPILLVCFDRRSPSLAALLQRRSFGISILSEGQRHLADRFGSRETVENPHAVEPEIRDELGGVPMLAGALAQIVCDIEQSLEAGSHTVIFGTPRTIAIHDASAQANALGYWRSGYVRLGDAIAR
jgi:flavin reductase (DIM6/NTAB) family NADH-FMN oxidoreductase RutF/predicted transcriptional regulator